MRKQNQRFVLLLAVFLMLAVSCAVPVWAQDASGPENKQSGFEGVVLTADGNTINETLRGLVESTGTGAFLRALNQGSVLLTAEDIYGKNAGAAVEVENSGLVTLNTNSIQSDAAGLSIYGGSGTVNVKNESFIDGYTAVSVVNENAELEINAGGLDSVVGVSIAAGGGTTKVESSDIYAEGFGVFIDAVGENSEPAVTVTVNGGIIDQYASDSWEDEVIEDPFGSVETAADAKAAEDNEDVSSDDTDPYDDSWWEQDLDGTWVGDDDDFDWGDDDWDGSWDDEGDDEPVDGEDLSGSTTGVLVNASGKGTTVKVDVTGEISMGYGNEVHADNEAVVTVSVGGNVITDYGNRVEAAEKGTVTLEFGDSIAAGGKAVDTYNDSGEMTITAKGQIEAVDSDDGDFETIGIYSASEGKGTTTIQAADGITVSSEEADYTAYGIAADNAGGKISITSENDLNVSGNEAVGIYVINDSDRNDFGEEENENGTESEPKAAETGTEPETNITVRGNVSVDASTGGSGAEVWTGDGKSEILVYGDLSGADTGMVVNAFDGSFTDILVTGTLSGNDAGLVVNEEADNDEQGEDNLMLTVWKLSPMPVRNEDGTENENVAENIRYIVGIAEEQKDQIIPTDENGNKLPVSHGFYYAKQGQRIYPTAAASFRLIQVYNGKNEPLLLPQDEQGRFYLDVQPGGAIWLSAETAAAPEPVSVPSMEFFRIGDLSWMDGVELPATGFSSRHTVSLPARPKGLDYKDTGYTLQIPGLDIEEKIVSVPEMNGSYPVEWLGSSVGLLDQSSLPGKGVTVLTGHNHLNTMESGPFLFIREMQEGDRILVKDARNNLQMYKVYGNYRIASDGFVSIGSEVRANALILITCEDESVDGGYLHRRVIMAEPL